LNPKQKFAFLLGVIAIAAMGMNPPWKEAGPKGLPVQYAPIYAPPTPLSPDKGLEIDFARLLLQIGVAGILSGGLVAAAAPNPQQGGNAQRIPAQPVQSVQQPWQTQFAPPKEEEEDDEEEDDIDVADAPNIIRLPAGKTYGEFLVESDDDPDYWESLSEARGVIRLPVGKRVQLEVKNDRDVDLSFVSSIGPATLHSVDLSESAVEDSQLAHIKQLSELKELDLSSTKVSNSALAHLQGLEKLEKLWLDGTALDDSCIDDLSKLSSLKKLSLKETKVTKDGVKKIQDSLTDCKIDS